MEEGFKMLKKAPSNAEFFGDIEVKYEISISGDMMDYLDKKCNKKHGESYEVVIKRLLSNYKYMDENGILKKKRESIEINEDDKLALQNIMKLKDIELEDEALSYAICFTLYNLMGSPKSLLKIINED